MPPTASPAPPPPSRGWELSRVWLVVPGLLAVLPVLIYAASPAAYVRLIVSEQYREYQAAEMVTFGCAVVGGLILVGATWRLWRVRPARDFGPAGARGLPDRWLALGLVGSAAAAALFFGGEEVNWGQTFANWGIAEREQGLETVVNLHNNTELISIQSLGSLYVLALFLVVPALWLLRKPLKWPAVWRPAIPPLASVVAVVLGLAFAEAKDLYAAAYDTPDSDRLYWDFIEQWNELKEMMIAVAFLLYGLSALGRARRVAARVSPPLASAPLASAPLERL